MKCKIDADNHHVFGIVDLCHPFHVVECPESLHFEWEPQRVCSFSGQSLYCFSVAFLAAEVFLFRRRDLVRHPHCRHQADLRTGRFWGVE